MSKREGEGDEDHGTSNYQEIENRHVRGDRQA
jgi:hypothetical protein